MLSNTKIPVETLRRSRSTIGLSNRSHEGSPLPSFKSRSVTPIQTPTVVSGLTDHVSSEALFTSVAKPLDILELKDREKRAIGESERVLSLSTDLLHRTASELKQRSFYPLTENQSQAIIEQKLIRISNYVSDRNTLRFYDMKSAFRSMDDQKIGEISQKNFTDLVVNAGLASEDEAAMLFYSQVASNCQSMKYDQFLGLLDTKRFLRRVEDVRRKNQEVTPRTQNLMTRGDPVKHKIFDLIRQRSRSKKDYRDNSKVLLSMFRQMDIRRDGFITYDDVRSAFGRGVLGLSLNDQEVYDLCRSIDIAGTGTISYIDWFCKMGEADFEVHFDPFRKAKQNEIEILNESLRQPVRVPPPRNIYSGIDPFYPQNSILPQQVNADGPPVDLQDSLPPLQDCGPVDSRKGSRHSSTAQSLSPAARSASRNRRPLSTLNYSTRDAFRCTQNKKIFPSPISQSRSASLFQSVQSCSCERTPAVSRFASSPQPPDTSYHLGHSHQPLFSTYTNPRESAFLTTYSDDYSTQRATPKYMERLNESQRKEDIKRQKWLAYEEMKKASVLNETERADLYREGGLRSKSAQQYRYLNSVFDRNYYDQSVVCRDAYKKERDRVYKISSDSVFAS